MQFAALPCATARLAGSVHDSGTAVATLFTHTAYSPLTAPLPARAAHTLANIQR
ncbi:hypothetical protein [uncultured Sulfitobacter sp.]|uniref:hypothetical protein n=1 Tax=uncultured Sulfitobacter sp. TaxID=191468 RepID=UPI00260CE1B9|nr:hypothetical protein [uncultured Sulfitobacter sp.]